MILANELKAEIKRNNMTQEQLAKAIGLNLATLNKKINGQSIFTVEEAQKISEALNIEADRRAVIFFS